MPSFLNIASTGEDATIFQKSNEKYFSFVSNIRVPFSVDALSTTKQGVFIQSIPISFTEFAIRHLYISFDIHISISGGGTVTDLILNDSGSPAWFPVFRGLSFNINGNNENGLLLGTSNSFAFETVVGIKRETLWNDTIINFCELVPIRDKQYIEMGECERYVNLQSKNNFFQIIHPVGFALAEDGSGIDFDGYSALFLNYFKTLLSATSTFTPIEYKQTVHVCGDILNQGYDL